MLKIATRQIATLSRKVKQDSDSDDTSDSNPEDDAVNSFGGREEKDQKKKKNMSKKWLIGRSYLTMILTLIYYLARSVRKQEQVIHKCNFTTIERRNILSCTILKNYHTEPVHHRRIELDFHADTIVFGRKCVVIYFTERECNVSLYTDPRRDSMYGSGVGRDLHTSV